MSGQHREMLDQVLSFFGLTPDFDLNLMKPNQSLLGLLAQAIIGLEPLIAESKPDAIIVQGDTTSVLAGSLVAFHLKIPLIHVEAGLRSNDMKSPFPEELNRVLTSKMADYHFAPTVMAEAILKSENHSGRIDMVGNTVVDALHIAEKIVNESTVISNRFTYLDFQKKVVLISCHRRESFGIPFLSICAAINELAKGNPSIQFVYPVHLNPNIKDIAHQKLTGKNIFLISPLDYPELVFLLSKCSFVMTDSGGIQEEAPSLNKPVLVLRTVTERMEGIESGTAILVGSDPEKIVKYATKLISEPDFYDSMANAKNPYGDGTSSDKIIAILKESL